MQGVSVPSETIPVVYPRYTKVEFYQGEAVTEANRSSPSTTKLSMQKNRAIQFDRLLQSYGKHRFICFVGFPGYGKTTCSKRLSKLEDFVCFHMRFMDMNYSEKLTLRELLLDKAYPNLSSDTCKLVFNWIVGNPSRCVIIFDGFDKVAWSLEANPPKEDYATPQHVQHLVANLCIKHFLPDSFIVLTSRPHSMVFLPKILRPNVTFFTGDLPQDGMKKLFFAYVGSDAQVLWDRLEATPPQLLNLSLNPLMLQLVIAAGLNFSDEVGKIPTTTRVFTTVLANLSHSENTSYEDIKKLTGQLSRVAFKCT
ncbi:NACHT, LRR and PYD domains-containing protein 3-like [Clavelina lepadiformis]|uniref:NACHT, LRR and PYD domains-containing protein 3-like n=1 Tax=Clavelina lepadiformis TaxID=159417 RepID=UPI0040424A84